MLEVARDGRASLQFRAATSRSDVLGSSHPSVDFTFRASHQQQVANMFSTDCPPTTELGALCPPARISYNLMSLALGTFPVTRKDYVNRCRA